MAADPDEAHLDRTSSGKRPAIMPEKTIQHGRHRADLGFAAALIGKG
jgi:hypothetical protein